MIKKFNEQEKSKIIDSLEGIQWFDGTVYTCGDIQKKVFFDMELVNKILYGKINIKDISEKDYGELIFAIKVANDFCLNVTGESDIILNKFLKDLEEQKIN